MTITYADFEKVDIRLGKVIEVLDFPEARNPAYKLKIDFGGPFISEVLTLGFKNTAGIGWVLIEPKKASVAVGDKLR